VIVYSSPLRDVEIGVHRYAKALEQVELSLILLFTDYGLVACVLHVEGAWPYT
jgi:hypothetical protein